MFEIVLPAIITIIGNVIFYLLIKRRIDNSIERSKIAYSGIFKEKVEIYRVLLKKTYEIKKDLNRFQFVGNKEDGMEIMEKINDYIGFYTMNQPFLSDDMLSEFKKLKTEFQEIFEKLYMHITNDNYDGLKEFHESTNKLRQNSPFQDIENKIISEMKQDLKVIEFNQ